LVTPARFGLSSRERVTQQFGTAVNPGMPGPVLGRAADTIGGGRAALSHRWHRVPLACEALLRFGLVQVIYFLNYDFKQAKSHLGY